MLQSFLEGETKYSLNVVGGRNFGGREDGDEEGGLDMSGAGDDKQNIRNLNRCV
jgi:hypothetical protein